MAIKKSKLKILMGFSGSLDSVVAAYLLKKQGHEVHAVGINFYIEGYETLSDQYDENGEVKPKSPFHGVYIIENLEEVKALADALGIPFYAVQAADSYQHYVTDKVVSSRVGGRSFSPKVSATRLILEILNAKADALDADMIATGHYAKLVRNQTLNAINVYVSNDLDNDQSYLLSTIDPPTLEKMILPLSDMRSDEVRKIGESLKLAFKEKPKESRTPLMDQPGLGNFVRDRMPQKLVREGNIIDYKFDSIMGEHHGIHQFGLGQRSLKSKTGVPFDKSLQVIGFKYAAGSVYLADSEDLMYDTIVLMHVKYAQGTDLSQPVEVFIKTKEKGERLAATLFNFNNRYAELKLKEPQKGLIFQGEFVAIYNRSGAMARVVGGGEVRTCGYIDFNELRTFPKKKEEIEADEDREKVDIYAFKF